MAATIDEKLSSQEPGHGPSKATTSIDQSEKSLAEATQIEPKPEAKEKNGGFKDYLVS